jgi:cell division protease FtsH
MLDDIRRWWARWRLSPAAWVFPLGLVTLLAAAAMAVRWWHGRPPAPTTITYSTFLSRLDQGAVREITVVPGAELRGVWSRPVDGTPAGGTFRVVYPTFEVTPVLDRAERVGAPVTLESNRGINPDFWREVLLVTVALSVVGLILRRQMGGGHDVGIGAARRSRTTFADVGGHDGTVAELRELVEFLRTPHAFQSVGARTPKGVLMFGPPGTGKTLMARAVAGEAGVPVLVISGSEVTGFLNGRGVARVK